MGKDLVVDGSTCRIVISARGLTVDSEYSFILHAATDQDSFNYTVNLKAAESTFESRAVSISMVEGTRLTLTVRNLTDPDAPAIATRTTDACIDGPRGAIRPAWR